MTDEIKPYTANDAPQVFVKHRQSEGTIDRSARCPIYWKHKVTGTTVEARRFLRVVPENEFKVIFFDPDIKVELSLPLAKMFEEYEPIGNHSDKF